MLNSCRFRSNLIQHRAVHKRPYICSICHKRFDKEDQLRKHLESVCEDLPCLLTWIRIFHIFGPGETRSTLLTQLDAALEAGFATPDLGGTHSTQQMTDAVINAFRDQ